MRGQLIRWVVVVLALAACQADAPVPSRGGSVLSGTEKVQCGNGGGTVGRGGMLGAEVCFMPTPDAGKACTKASDCSGMCMAETRTCSTHTPQFGCFEFLDEQGQKVGLCVD